MRTIILIILFVVPRCYAQSDSVTAYYHKAKDFHYILLLGCNNVGYSYFGPHLFTDEVFSYERTGDAIIRTFDANHSLRYRLDTLMVDKKLLRDTNGLHLKKVSSKKKNKLITKYIQPSADAGFYEFFLERLKACKND